jgi:hypothetical protein
MRSKFQDTKNNFPYLPSRHNADVIFFLPRNFGNIEDIVHCSGKFQGLCAGLIALFRDWRPILWPSKSSWPLMPGVEIIE